MRHFLMLTLDQILSQLRDCRQKWPTTSVGQIITTIVKQLEVHIPYCKNWGASEAVLEFLSKHKRPVSGMVVSGVNNTPRMIW